MMSLGSQSDITLTIHTHATICIDFHVSKVHITAPVSHLYRPQMYSHIMNSACCTHVSLYCYMAPFLQIWRCNSQFVEHELCSNVIIQLLEVVLTADQASPYVCVPVAAQARPIKLCRHTHTYAHIHKYSIGM
jgi:hypothetical protein